MKDVIREDARIVILKELHLQGNYALNDSILSQTLDAFGIFKSRDWLREELRWLEDVGAVTLTTVGSVIIAQLTSKGVEHVERRLVIPGIKRPGPAQG